MTDQTETTEDQTEATTPAADTPAQDTTEAGGGNREAAKYRRQLRDAEAERDQLRGRLEGLQRVQAEGMAGLAHPAALWAVAELSDLLDDDGGIDPERVKEAAAQAREQLGTPTTPQPVFESPGSHRTTHSDTTADAFVRAFEPKQ